MKSMRRKITSLLLWSALLLVLINVGWSVWFAQNARMNGELMLMLEMQPTPESFGVSLDPNNSETVNLAYRRELGVQTRYWLFRAHNEDLLTAEQVAAQREHNIGSFEAVAPWWLRRRHARYAGLVAGEDDYTGEVSVTIGWPVRLLWCAWRREGNDFYIAPGTGISLEDPTGAVGTGFLGLVLKECYSRALPCRPVLSGQTVTFLACVALVGAVGSGARGFKRLMRRRHGKCMNCRYDLRGNTTGVCPECGERILGANHG